MSANQAYGLACITALTVQNTLGTRSYRAIPASVLEEQLECLLSDVTPRAIKIGMLGGKDTIEVVARQLERARAPWVVLDPVHAATNGTRLSDDTGWAHMRKRLFPLVTVLTPNLPEAALLTGVPLESITKQPDMEKACVALHAMLAANGAQKYIVLKGGHLERPLDLLYDGANFTPFP
ncbi:MAG TPA: bifunctional hydroxymethylpyrimidine kinase/phosphomethylpyrimidine kinase, partial [Terriglobales bacterium]